MNIDQTTFTVSVPAKLNLSLAITGKREGLHTLDMIVCPYYKYEDVVSFCPQEGVEGVTSVKTDSDLQDFDEERFEHVIKDKLDIIAKLANVGGSIYIRKLTSSIVSI